MEGMVHCGAKLIVEVPEGCMIVFTNDTFHAGVKSYTKYGGNYLSHLRLVAYIVDETFIFFDESIERKKTKECGKNCTICVSLFSDNIHYEAHIIRYLKYQCDIDNLNTDNILIGDLEKVGWVVLKYDYEIKNGGEQQNYFYQINNNIHSKKRNTGTK